MQLRSSANPQLVGGWAAFCKIALQTLHYEFKQSACGRLNSRLVVNSGTLMPSCRQRRLSRALQPLHPAAFRFEVFPEHVPTFALGQLMESLFQVGDPSLLFLHNRGQHEAQ